MTLVRRSRTGDAPFFFVVIVAIIMGFVVAEEDAASSTISSQASENRSASSSSVSCAQIKNCLTDGTKALVVGWRTHFMALFASQSRLRISAAVNCVCVTAVIPGRTETIILAFVGFLPSYGVCKYQ